MYNAIIHIYDIFNRHKNKLGKLRSKGNDINCTVADCWRITTFLKYMEQFQNIYNYISLTWVNKGIYYIPTNIFAEINESTNNKVYFLALSIKRVDAVNHANMIIINTMYKYAVRFEPYGNVNWDNIDIFDDIFESEMKKVLIDYTYYRPKHYLPNYIFQAVSGENDPLFTKIGDPPGYCQAWSYWFLESYLSYAKKLKNNDDLKYFVNSLYEKIKNNYRSLLDYIRTYGNYLKEREIKILDKNDIAPERFYANQFTIGELSYIYKTIDHSMK